MTLAQAYAVIEMDDRDDSGNTPHGEAAWETMVAEANALITVECESNMRARSDAGLSLSTRQAYAVMAMDAVVDRAAKSLRDEAWLTLVNKARGIVAAITAKIQAAKSASGAPECVVVEDDEPTDQQGATP